MNRVCVSDRQPLKALTANKTPSATTHKPPGASNVVCLPIRENAVKKIAAAGLSLMMTRTSNDNERL